MARYVVSMRVEGRVEVEVDADSFDGAFGIAEGSGFDWNDVELVGYEPVNATDEKGTMEDYNG